MADNSEIDLQQSDLEKGEIKEKLFIRLTEEDRRRFFNFFFSLICIIAFGVSMWFLMKKLYFTHDIHEITTNQLITLGISAGIMMGIGGFCYKLFSSNKVTPNNNENNNDGTSLHYLIDEIGRTLRELIQKKS